MNDNALRGKLLQELYDNRREPWSQIGLNLANSPTAQETVRIAEQLSQHNLIEFKMLNRHIGGQARITAFGVDVIEGTATSPISVSVGATDTINISNSSNVQIGDNNAQVINDGVRALVKTINESGASQAEKDDAKSLLSKFLTHPLVSAAVGGAIALLG